MSFAEKIANLMARPNQQPGPADDQPWYIKYGVRMLGITGAFFYILSGLINVLTSLIVDVSCLITGILQVFVGFVVMALEAPCCFFCIEYVGQMADMVDSKPLWYKAAIYCIGSIFPVFSCFGLGTLFACALVFGTGVIYGMMALGKKASAADMRQAAVNSGVAGGQTTNDRAGIINNAQPFSFTGAVGTDSNV